MAVIPDRPQLVDRGGKDRLLRAACGKLPEFCGERVDFVGKSD